MRKLATVRVIDKLSPIEGADFIERATVGGWQCVVRKGEFQEGDQAVYFEIDSFLPVEERYEFLRKSSYKKLEDGREGFRLRTIRLRGTLSQGLLLPMPVFPELKTRPNEDAYPIGRDVTEVLNVEKWDPPLPANLAGEAIGLRPAFVPKTDAERIQNLSEQVVEEFKYMVFEATEKIDGTSMSVYFNPDEAPSFGVCSRNLSLKESEGNSLWQVANELKLRETLTQYGHPIVLQGELAGPGIQKNPLKLRKPTFFLFHIWDIPRWRYVNASTRRSITSDLRELGSHLEHVPVLTYHQALRDHPTLADLLAASERPSLINPNVPLEGIVYKGTTYEGLVISFKVLNNQLLADEKDAQ